jgi:pimeloyl-ACP methyl ester carboxylesterase
MYKIILIICFFLTSKMLFAQKITGSWAGELAIQGTKLPLIFNIKQDDNSYSSTFDSPMQGATAIPVAKTTFVNNELILDANNLGIQYKGSYENDQISGTFTQGKMTIPLVLSRKTSADIVIKRPQTPKAPFDYNIEDVLIVNPLEKNTLAGTLTTPRNKKEFPVVILITGSGQQNRDEELFDHKPFWVIADDFAKKGIGVLRLDDRGIGGSSNGNENPTTQNFASDINAAVDFLSAKGYPKIGLIGHSEGGMIAPMVACENKKVSFIITMAGLGISGNELLLLQAAAFAKANGVMEAEIKMNTETNQRIYAKINGFSGDNLESELKNLLLEELKKMPKDKLPPEDKIQQLIDGHSKQVSSPWFVYFLKWNPDAYWNKLKIPVLALNGSLDLQVTPKENLAGIKSSLVKAKNKDFEILEMPGLNHLFQEAKTGSVEEYSQLEQTISPTVLDKMSAWILKR